MWSNGAPTPVAGSDAAGDSRLAAACHDLVLPERDRRGRRLQELTAVHDCVIAAFAVRAASRPRSTGGVDRAPGTQEEDQPPPSGQYLLSWAQSHPQKLPGGRYRAW